MGTTSSWTDPRVDDYGFAPQTVRNLVAAGREGEAVAYMNEFINAGSILAMTTMARHCQSRRDESAAISWIDRAEAALKPDDDEGPIYLAGAYSTMLGRGDYLEQMAKARLLYEKVGEAGNLVAIHMLMSWYLHGLNGTPKDHDRYLYWVRKAAALDSRKAKKALREDEGARTHNKNTKSMAVLKLVK